MCTRSASHDGQETLEDQVRSKRVSLVLLSARSHVIGYLGRMVVREAMSAMMLGQV
jgi:hypothetical protein